MVLVILSSFTYISSIAKTIKLSKVMEYTLCMCTTYVSICINFVLTYEPDKFITPD